MQSKYTQNALVVQKLAQEAAKECGHSYAGSEHLLIGLLREPEGTGGVILRENKVDEEKLLALIDQLIAPDSGTAVKEKGEWTPRAVTILEGSIEEAHLVGDALAGTEHILLAILKDVECAAARLLYTMGINLQKLYVEVLEVLGISEERMKELLRDVKNGGESSTPVLDQYSTDLTEQARNHKLDVTVGREQEISRMIQILSRRTKNNPCLIGEPGVGKTADCKRACSGAHAGKTGSDS